MTYPPIFCMGDCVHSACSLHQKEVWRSMAHQIVRAVISISSILSEPVEPTINRCIFLYVGGRICTCWYTAALYHAVTDSNCHIERATIARNVLRTFYTCRFVVIIVLMACHTCHVHARQVNAEYINYRREYACRVLFALHMKYREICTLLDLSTSRWKTPMVM